MKFISIGSGSASDLGYRAYAIIDTEAQWTAALNAGHSCFLRGGAEGKLMCTTPKLVTQPFTHITGPCEVVFSMDHTIPPVHSAIWILANDCTLENFKLRSTAPLISLNYLYGIGISDGRALGHRTTLCNLEICDGWNRCLAKHTGVNALNDVWLDDILIEHCYFHTFCAAPAGFGVELMFGLNRLVMRDCRIEGRVGSESHTTGYGMKCGPNNKDCTFERVYVKNCDGMGIECNIIPYNAGIEPPTTVNERPVFRDIIIEDCGHFGLSLGHPHGAVLDNIRIKNVKGRGIEIGAWPADKSWATLNNCRIDGVLDSTDPAHPGMAQGIAIDKCFDTTITGGWVKNVNSVTLGPPQARGCFLYQCQNCLVDGVTFEDIGGRYIDNDRGLGGLSGYHVVENCVFRQSNIQPAQVSAIWITENYLYARNNTAFKKAGSNLGFWVFGSPAVPASVWSENQNAITSLASTAQPFDSTMTGGGFVSSNLIQTV